MKPVIAVSAQTAVSDTEYYGQQSLTSLYDLYVRAITAAGGIPVVLAHGDPGDAAVLLDRFDALVLPGGGDIDPANYGETPSTDHLYGIRPQSDEFEFALVREAAARKLPMLGICRGLQVINVAFGGSLHQHLEFHPKDKAGRAFSGHYRTTIRTGSRLERIVGVDELVVNSLHHQGVDRAGVGISVAATATDAVVEAIEAVDPLWEMVAVQWHPECLRSRYAAAIFQWLVEAAARRVAGREGSVSLGENRAEDVAAGIPVLPWRGQLAIPRVTGRAICR